MMFGRIAAVLLSIFLCMNTAHADDMEQLKAQVIQMVKEHENEIHMEAMREFHNMDTDGNGVVDVQEFVNFQSYGTVTQKKQAFLAIDVNHDGDLTEDELWNFMHKKINALQ